MSKIVEVWGSSNCPRCRAITGTIASLGFMVEHKNFDDVADEEGYKRIDLMAVAQENDGEFPILWFEDQAMNTVTFSGLLKTREGVEEKA